MSILFLCIKIFFARIVDVTLGTLRTIITIKDKIILASLIGFFEVLIWFIVVQEAIETGGNNIYVGIFYALGFAFGTYIGGILSRKVIKGNLSVQVITSKASDEWITDLRDNGFAVSIVDMREKNNEPNKFMLFIEINNTDFNKLHKIVKKHDKKAFIVVNESKTVVNGFFNSK